MRKKKREEEESYSYSWTPGPSAEYELLRKRLEAEAFSRADSSGESYETLLKKLAERKERVMGIDFSAPEVSEPRKLLGYPVVDTAGRPVDVEGGYVLPEKYAEILRRWDPSAFRITPYDRIQIVSIDLDHALHEVAMSLFEMEDDAKENVFKITIEVNSKFISSEILIKT